MKKIGFALLSSSSCPLPSTRIACLNLFSHLRYAGFEPEVLLDPVVPCEEPDVGDLVAKALARSCDIVVFQKIRGRSVAQAATRLRSAGVKTIYCVCDLVDDQMAEATDATIVVTNFLKTLYRPELRARVHVVHDGIERPDLMHEPHPAAHLGRTLEACLVTSQELYAIPVLGFPPHGWRVNVIGRFPPRPRRMARVRAARWSLSQAADARSRFSLLSAMLHPGIRHVAWDPEAVYDHLARTDIGIIPIDTSERSANTSTNPSWKLKSENRLTLKMAMGLPVIATAIPAYEEVIENGRNGFFAVSRRDWLRCFDHLRDPDRRREIGSRARESVLPRFSIDAQARSFLAVLRSLTTGGTNSGSGVTVVEKSGVVYKSC